MSEKRRGNRRRLVIIALATASIFTGAAMVAVLSGSSSPSAPGADEMQAIETTIQQRFDLESAAVATEAQPSFATAAEVPESIVRDAEVAYEKGLNEVGTSEFVACPGVKGWPQMIADVRQHSGVVILREEYRILDLEYQRTLSNGDVVLWVKMWLGEVRREWPETVGAGNPRLTSIDTTPTYQYQMRKVDGQWKIVAETLVFDSDDDSPTQYGPDTPHYVNPHPAITGDEGLIIATPAPQASVE